MTYTRQLGTAVTALGSSATLLNVKNAELTTGSLDNSGPVGGGVVADGVKLLSVICGSFSFIETFRTSIPSLSNNLGNGVLTRYGVCRSRGCQAFCRLGVWIVVSRKVDWTGKRGSRSFAMQRKRKIWAGGTDFFESAACVA